MDNYWKTILWNQFGASINMLENAIQACPDDLWKVNLWKDPSISSEFSEFWYVAYHTLFWLDLYLHGSLEGFEPPPPFNLRELDPAGLMPGRTYSREELQTYLDHCRNKCRMAIEGLTDERASHICSFFWLELSFAELLLDTMRHVQEHAAQLNLVLGQQIGLNNPWIAQVKK
jgi:hypothetical protein